MVSQLLNHYVVTSGSADNEAANALVVVVIDR